MTEYEKTVLIKIKDQDPLNVCANRLTADSSVFGRLIDDLGLTEIEIEDFEPDIVILFLTLLEDKKLDKIEDAQFRELHKISAAFKVYWLVGSCRSWLCTKILCLTEPLNYTSLLFLFEESLFIVKKWDAERPMNLLVTILMRADTKDFINRYITNLNDMETTQLFYLLKLAGTDQTIFIEIMKNELDDTQSLTDNLKYLLNNINFKQIHAAKDQKYEEVFEKIANLPEITSDELRWVFKILSRYSKNKDPSPRKDSVINNSELDFSDNFNNALSVLKSNGLLTCYSSIVPYETFYKALHRGLSRRKFYVRLLVDLLFVMGDIDSIRQAAAVNFISLAESLAHFIDVKQVSVKYLDMLIEILALSPKENKDAIIKYMLSIRQNETLSTYSAVPLDVSGTSMRNLSWWTDSNVTFRCSFSPVKDILPSCKCKGDCGFLLAKSMRHKPPPVKYARCFLTWTAIYTFSTITSIDGAYSILQYSRGLMRTQYVLRDLLGIPLLNAAADVMEMKTKEMNSYPLTVSEWHIDRNLSLYGNQEIHFHDYFSEEDVELFTIQSATMKDGKQILLPMSMNWRGDINIDWIWKKWLPDIKTIGSRKLSAHYFVDKFLVAKKQRRNKRENKNFRRNLGETCEEQLYYDSFYSNTNWNSIFPE